MTEERVIHTFKFNIKVTVKELDSGKVYNVRIPFLDHNERVKDFYIECVCERDACKIAKYTQRGGLAEVKSHL